MARRAQIGDGRTGSSGLNAGRGANAGGQYGRGGSSPSTRRPTVKNTTKPRKAAPPAAAKRVPSRTTVRPDIFAPQSSVTKMTSGWRPTRNPSIKADVTKRRIGTQGAARGSVKAKANKEIKRERKARGEYLYDKPTYGRKSVNAKMPKSVVSKGQKASGARYAAAAKKRGK